MERQGIGECEGDEAVSEEEAAAVVGVVVSGWFWGLVVGDGVDSVASETISDCCFC